MKNMKIKLTAAALTAMMTLSATGCEIEVKKDKQSNTTVSSVQKADEAATEASEVQTSPTDTATTAALDTTSAAPAVNADTKPYAAAYVDIINGYGASNEDVKFAFAHIDGDEIPELIISDFRAYQEEQREDRKIFALSIYTYKEDQAVTVLKEARSDNGI